MGPTDNKTPLTSRLRVGFNYAFGDLLRDIGSWLLIGVLIAALIGILVPDAFLERYLDRGWISMLIMLAIGIPLYICASASTPIAAALILKGLSPGAALVFLLAGPATNAATITIVTRYWGRQAAMIYLGTIAFSSLALGWMVNLFYSAWSLDITKWVHPATADDIALWQSFSALVLVGLIFRTFLNKSSDTKGCSE